MSRELRGKRHPSSAPVGIRVASLEPMIRPHAETRPPQLRQQAAVRTLATWVLCWAWCCTPWSSPSKNAPRAPARPLPVQARPLDSAPTAATPPPLRAATPTPLAAWQIEHQRQLALPERSQARVLVLGGEDAARWFDSRAFQEQWADQQPLHLALEGESLSRLLWRVERGLLVGIQPRLTLLLIGRHDLDQGLGAEQVAQGTRAVAAAIHRALPKTPLVVVGVLPVGQAPGQARRLQGESVNRLLESRLGRGAPHHGRATFVNVTPLLTDEAGRGIAELMLGYEHPTPFGHQALTMAVSLVAEGAMRDASDYR